MKYEGTHLPTVEQRQASDRELDNQAIIQQCKDSNGILYHRLNSLQVENNRLREENKRLEKLSFSKDEIRKMRETFEHALEYLK